MPEELPVRVDEQDLTELVGNVVENPVKWARGRVLVRVSGGQSHCTLEVGDDGPGVPDRRGFNRLSFVIVYPRGPGGDDAGRATNLMRPLATHNDDGDRRRVVVQRP